MQALKLKIKYLLPRTGENWQEQNQIADYAEPENCIDLLIMHENDNYRLSCHNKDEVINEKREITIANFQIDVTTEKILKNEIINYNNEFDNLYYQFLEANLLQEALINQKIDNSLEFLFPSPNYTKKSCVSNQATHFIQENHILPIHNIYHFQKIKPLSISEKTHQKTPLQKKIDQGNILKDLEIKEIN